VPHAGFGAGARAPLATLERTWGAAPGSYAPAPAGSAPSAAFARAGIAGRPAPSEAAEDLPGAADYAPADYRPELPPARACAFGTVRA
jgi:hypothetical protein